jgi:hypothetical protein
MRLRSSRRVLDFFWQKFPNGSQRETYKTPYEVMNHDADQKAPFEKYSTTRGLVRGKVIFRILINWNELKAHFLTAQPASTQVARFMDMLKDPILYRLWSQMLIQKKCLRN